MYKHIIWDYDGTLFDSYPVMTRAFKTVLKEQGIYDSSEKIMSLMRISMAHLIEYYKSNYEIGETFISKYAQYRKKLELEYLKPFLNVEYVCRRIHSLNRMNYLYTHRGKSSKEFLNRFHMYDYFKDFVTKENNFKRKPDPEAILFLINKHKINKDEALMIGDRDIDLLAAKNAGIHACFFNNNESDECEFADYTISDFSQLMNIIENIDN